jgi:hypothetical protein
MHGEHARGECMPDVSQNINNIPFKETIHHQGSEKQ